MLKKHYWNNLLWDTKQVELLVCSLLIFTLASTTIGPFEVRAQDLAVRASNVIFNADYKIREASSILTEYWNNISDETQKDASSDINLALSYLHDAKQELNEGFYNWSLQEACQSLFLAGRCEYRVYLDMAKLKIEEANKTISSVPWYLGKPWYAMDILQNATTVFRAQNISEYFLHIPYDENASALDDEVQYIVYNRIEEQAIPNLFSKPQSAYNLALKSENLAITYQDEQNGIFWPLFLIGVICSSIVLFLIGLVLGIRKGESIRRHFHAWWMRRKKTFTPYESMLEKERRFLLMIVEANGVMVTALFTIGALTGAVMQQVKYVYQFIGYMFEYALPFIFSAVMGIANLYVDRRSKKFPDLFDLTVAFFISGWLSFAFLFGLATQYGNVSQNLYYIIPITYILVTFTISFGISLCTVYFLRISRGRFSAKYLSLSSLTEE